jgi:hypothetical protein
LRSDWIISGTGHAAVLAFGLISLAGSKPIEDLSNYMPVTIVSDADVSRAPSGVQNAPKVEHPKPLAEKIAEPKPVKELAPKVVEKPEIKTDVPTPEPKPEPQPEAKPKPKVAEAKPDPKPETKPDPIAKELKKEQGKKPAKAEKKTPAFKPDEIAQELKKDETKKPPSPKFDPKQVAALLDKREPQRQMAAGATLNNVAALGAPTGHGEQLSQSELDALRARLTQCWSPPPGVDATSKVYVVLRVQFKPGGSLAREPDVVEDTGSGSALAASAKRALLLCQPFTMLKPEHYDLWKDIEVKFDSQLLLGG